MACAWNLRVLTILHGANGTFTKLTGLPVASCSCLNLAFDPSSHSNASPANTMHAPDTAPATLSPFRNPNLPFSACNAGPHTTPPTPVPAVTTPIASARLRPKCVGLTVTAGMKLRLVAHPRRKPCVSWNCQSVREAEASVQARARTRPPAAMMRRGGKRLVRAVTKGALMVMKATERVPIRSMPAGEAPVKGVEGWDDMAW